MAFLLIFSLVSGLLDQLEIFQHFSYRNALAFNRSGAMQAVAFDISKAFGKFLHADFLHKRKSYGISV